MNRILIIDDDTELCALVARYLSSEGFAVDRAADGSQGIEMGLSGSYALIMLDVMMPDLNGFDVLRRIRERSRTPVLMLSASDVEAAAWRAGVDAYLRKPEDVARLTDVVGRLLPAKR